jgi:hypothetical protein
MSEEKEVGVISDHTDPRYSRKARFQYLLNELWGKPDGSGGRWDYSSAADAANDQIAREWDKTRDAIARHALTGE